MQMPEEWHGWYFEDGYLCSPQGDRFTAPSVMACLFVRQMETYREILYGNWKETLLSRAD